MAAWRTDVGTWNTTAGAKSATVTTVAGDLLVAVVGHSGPNTGARCFAVTDDQGGVWEEILFTSYLDTINKALAVWVRTKRVVTGVSTIVTTTPTFTTTGGGLDVIAVSGMTRENIAAIRSYGFQPGQALGTTPAPVLSRTPLTANMIIGAVLNTSNTAGVTEPASFTERQDLGYNTPVSGLETATIDSGITNATVTWGSTSATAFVSAVIELDISAPDAQLPPMPWHPQMRLRGPHGGPPVLVRQRFDAPITTGTTTPQSVDATTTFTAALVRTALKPLAVAVTLTATLVRMTGKVLATAASVAADAAKQVSKTVAAVVTLTATLTKNAGKLVATAVTLTADMARSLVKSVAVAVTVTLTAALTRAVGKLIAVTATLTAALVRAVGKVVAVTVTLTAALARNTGKIVDATTTFTAGLIKQVGKTLDAAATFTIALARIVVKTVIVDVASTVAADLSKMVGKPLAASVTITASTVRSTAKAVAVAATVAADLTKRVAKTVAAGITATIGLVAEKIAGGGTTFYQAIAAAVRFIIRTPLD